MWALNKVYIAPQINAAQGVADVAIVGGSPLEYQIDVRPEDLRAARTALVAEPWPVVEQMHRHRSRRAYRPDPLPSGQLEP